MSPFRTLLLATCCGLAAAQQPFPGQGAEPEPLHTTLMNMFDEDKDASVTLDEVNRALQVFGAMMGGMGGAPPGQPASGPSEAEVMIKMAQKGAPALFQLLDADGSAALSSAELEWVQDAYAAVRKPMLLKNLTVDVFAALDADADEIITMDELRAAVDGEASRATCNVAPVLNCST